MEDEDYLWCFLVAKVCKTVTRTAKHGHFIIACSFKSNNNFLWLPEEKESALRKAHLWVESNEHFEESFPLVHYN